MSRFMLMWTMAVLCPTILFAEGTPQVLARGQGTNAPKQPQAFVAADGTIDVVYAIGDRVHLATSRDQGMTFAPASATIQCPNMAAGMRRGPRVVRSKSAVVVTAIGGAQGKGKDGDLMSWHSTDDSATWSEAVNVNDSAASAREGLHGMTVGTDGAVWCVWLDLRNGKTEIYTAVSKDDGKTWEKNTKAYRSPGGSVCECCHPSIIANAKSGASVMFRNSVGGQRDMFLLGSTDGEKFSAGKKLGKGTWKLDACPMDGGMLASDGKDQLVTVWQRQNQVFATSGNGQVEKPLGAGQQPWAAWSAAGPVLVWTQGKEGVLSMQLGLNGKPRQLAPLAHDPVVASTPSSDFAIVCWEAKEGGQTSIVAQSVVTPAGTSKKAK